MPVVPLNVRQVGREAVEGEHPGERGSKGSEEVRRDQRKDLMGSQNQSQKVRRTQKGSERSRRDRKGSEGGGQAAAHGQWEKVVFGAMPREQKPLSALAIAMAPHPVPWKPQGTVTAPRQEERTCEGMKGAGKAQKKSELIRRDQKGSEGIRREVVRRKLEGIRSFSRQTWACRPRAAQSPERGGRCRRR